jgi:hypothetical protein
VSVRPVFDRECITAVVVAGRDFNAQYRAHTAAFRR